MSNAERGRVHGAVDDRVSAREDWALRRRRGIPNNRKLFVLTCMDERVAIEDALGLELGDAHVFRNAGGIVTDDAIRSAALTTNFFQTVEIIVVQHTDCGMLLHTGDELAAGLDEKLSSRGTSLAEVELDPSLPSLDVPASGRGDWIKTFRDVDESVIRQVELLQNHPLIPEGVVVHGYVYEVESGELRRPRVIPGAEVSTSPAREVAGASRG